MPKSKIDIAVDYLRQRGWEFRPAEKIKGVFKPMGKYDAKNPAENNFSVYDNKTLRKYACMISLAESEGKTWKYT